MPAPRSPGSRPGARRSLVLRSLLAGLAIAATAALASAAPAAAAAGLPPEPPPLGLAIEKPIKSQCAAILDPATGGYPFVKQPDKPCWTGSIAKALTIDVAIQAIKAGKLDPADMVQFSDDAVDEGCNCLGGYATSLPAGVDAADYAVAGDRMRLDDALAGTAMSAVEPTVGTAELVAQAVNHSSKQPAADEEESQALRHEFVELMNERFADLGLTDSVFSNEHGGWEGLSGLPNPKSTPRDMVRFWLAAKDEHPLFLQSLGLRSKHAITTGPAGTKHYAFNKWYGYYPRVEGDKAGGVMPAGEPFWNSLLGSTTRLGRTLSWIVMQNDDDGDDTTPDNAFDDSGRILDQAFRGIFEPDLRAHSGNQAAKVSGNAVSCWGADRCVTASDTSGDDLKLIVWSPKAGDKSVQRLGAAEIVSQPPPNGPAWQGNQPGTTTQPGVDEVDVVHLGVGQIPAPGPGGLTQGTRPTRSVSPQRATAAGIPTVSGNRIVVSAQAHDDDVILRSWKVTSGGSIIALSKATLPNEGTGIGVERLGTRRFVSSARIASNGRLRLRSWHVSNNGQFSQLHTKTTGGAIAGAASLASTGAPTGVVTAVQLPNNRSKLILWTVDGAGTIVRRGSSGEVDVAKPKVTKAGGAFMLAGVAPDTKAQVHVFQPSSTGDSISYQGNATDIEGQSVTEVSIAPIAHHAALLATRRAGKLALRVIDFDPAYEATTHVEGYHVLGSASGGTSSLLDIGRLEAGHAATGDFALARRDANGRLKVESWRVGEKP